MSGAGRKNRCGVYYDAPSNLRVPTDSGVTVRLLHQAVEYRGTAEALVGIGLVPLHLLPGQPGMPLTMVSLRPRGVEPAPGLGWHRTPGRLVVRRHLDGTFIATLRGCVEDKAPSEPQRADGATPITPEFLHHLRCATEKAAAWAEAHRETERELLANSPRALQAWGFTRAVLERLGARHG